ncbi:SpaH/EbpB family LPXTG-anchored major pilin [Streptococcus sciuri]|uniref:SpaH/EbpB family LPXTG-anchored major pilin n=1 Tax=Streptococcus sciuri TaxID=2973939 RepID=A0ABT2F8U3_9STRE|nr:SpaH/EbpB family LPXTG-anchored major pilin [Streptococcus sciuri]MCS4488888.1 SpaH/EbpB family LPXTG-anchored major pilin [Streptococcus sciuri]
MKILKHILATILTTFIVVFVGGTAHAQSVDSQQSGAATITINNASQGQTYTVYKLFDATVDGKGAISYRLPSGKTDLGNGTTWFDLDAKGNITAKEGADVSTDDFKTWAAGYGTQVAIAKATDNTLVFTGLAYGFYYIKSSLGATITVDSTNPNATIRDKNTTGPSIPDKNEGGGKHILVNGSTVDETTAKVGDTVKYQIKFVATNFLTTETDSKRITNYTVVDTPTNLSIDQDSVEVKVGNQTITGANVATTFDDTGKMTIKLNWQNGTQTIYDSPSDVVITYSATVKKGAADADATNSATITYDLEDGTTDKPIKEDPQNPNQPEPEQTTVKTHRFTLKKVNSEGTTLSGAHFKLYDAANNGKEIHVIKEGDHYRVAEDNEQYEEIEAGEVTIKGLKGDDTTYYLDEVKAPDGYNILDDRQAVTVKSDDSASIDVVNEKGAKLPSTGSFGTKMLYLLGSLFVVGALIVMVSKRRTNNM